MPDKSLVEQLTEAIDENGTLAESTRKRLMLMVMTETYNNTLSIAKCIPEMKDNIKTLTDKSIVIQAQKHPKMATTLIVACLVFIFILFTIWMEIGISTAVTSILGM
jgi:hypothetical protein